VNSLLESHERYNNDEPSSSKRDILGAGSDPKRCGSCVDKDLCLFPSLNYILVVQTRHSFVFTRQEDVIFFFHLVSHEQYVGTL
jgi:hypothetical protein